MRCLEKNKQIVYYALFDGKEEIVNGFGEKTGEYEVKYKPIVKAMQNVSPARRNAMFDEFGITNPYSKTIATDDVSTEFDTSTVYWIGFGNVDEYADEVMEYHTGDMCLHNGGFFLCKSFTMGAFDSTKWIRIPPNYIVVNVAKSAANTVLAIREVDKS